jgi:hypothetical protein
VGGCLQPMVRPGPAAARFPLLCVRALRVLSLLCIQTRLGPAERLPRRNLLPVHLASLQTLWPRPRRLQACWQCSKPSPSESFLVRCHFWPLATPRQGGDGQQGGPLSSESLMSAQSYSAPRTEPAVQYQWLRALAEETSGPGVVGDTDISLKGECCQLGAVGLLDTA